jgi:hypothetical protein
VNLTTPRDKTPPPVAGPSSAPDLVPASLDTAAIPLATNSFCAPASSGTVSTLVLSPNSGSAPALSPAVCDSSQNIPTAHGDMASVSLTTTPSTDPPSRPTEVAALAATLESPIGPPISVPAPAVGSADQSDFQDAQDTPSTSANSKTTSAKPSGKKAKKQKAKKITAR